MVGASSATTAAFPLREALLDGVHDGAEFGGKHDGGILVAGLYVEGS